MRTSYRDVFLLACCQALLLTNSAGLITMNGLVGYRLADTKSLATLGVTSYVLGSAVATMPASLWMAKVGRRAGFMAGALINVGGCALAALAHRHRQLCALLRRTAVIGVYTAIGLQYRFAAAEVSAPKDKPRAISLVLAGWHCRRISRPGVGAACGRSVRGAIPRRIRRARRVCDRSARRAGERPRSAAGRRGKLGARDGRCPRSCGSRCSSSPRSAGGSATGS